MNRTGLGLAIGAGYLLGRTKKLKMAVAVGGLVAGRKLNLSPRMVAELVSQQMRDNPQFKELGDQLRGDLRGVGKAASGALVERQIGSLADRLHGRTAAMRDELTGGAPESAEPDEDTDDDARQEQEQEQEQDRDREREPDDEAGSAREEHGEQRRAERPAKKAAAKKAPAKKAPPAKKAAKRTPPAKKTAAKKTAAASRGGRSRTSKGGGER